jgi:hypothetical protein
MEKTITATETMIILKAKEEKKVRWDTKVVDNENMGKKKSKGKLLISVLHIP